MRFALLLALVVGFAGGCNRQKDEVIEPGGPPPLPPASGTAVGYLVDAAADLQLSGEQLEKLKKIDDSLAAQNGSIEAQIRQIEQPVPAEQLSPQQMKAGEKEQRYDNAPGKSTMQTSDSQRLHKLHDENERDALKRAFALLDAKQLEKAKRILQDRGVDIPGEAKQEAPRSEDDGTPLPGMEP
jgi:hypothetical protein